ncbi:winged helix-turn-helix domain-containing protein [Paenibacillus sp. FSL P2-0089]|uniref:winged helix-turn-helix domain-containing protein n=1 Tax=Paenibacillus sp. FSL P2-0089 TaxID=2954526 RepID=UPI00315A072B
MKPVVFEKNGIGEKFMRVALVCCADSTEPCEDCRFKNVHSFFAQVYGCKVLHFKELEALVDIVKEGLQLDGVVISTPDFNPGFIHTMQYLQQMLTLRIFFIVEEISAQGTPVPFPSNHMYISSFERNGFQEELFSRLRCWFDEGLAPHTHHTRQIKDIALHLHSKSLKVGEFVIELTCKEFELLELLLECQGQYIPTEQILHQLWDRYTSPEIVRQYVYKLRHKIEIISGRSDIILFRRGIGYSVNPLI